MAIGTSSDRNNPSRLPKNGESTPESIEDPSVCIVRIGSTTSGQSRSLSVAPMISSPPNVGDSGCTRDRNDCDVRVVQGADEVLVALVEVLGIDAVADVDEATRARIVRCRRRAAGRRGSARSGSRSRRRCRRTRHRAAAGSGSRQGRRRAVGGRVAAPVAPGRRRSTARRPPRPAAAARAANRLITAASVGRCRCRSAGTRRYWRRGLQPVPAVPRPSLRLRPRRCLPARGRRSARLGRRRLTAHLDGQKAFS